MNILRQRADLLRRLRAFFDERGFLEVETPLVSDEIIPELHIEPFAVSPAGVTDSSWSLKRPGRRVPLAPPVPTDCESPSSRIATQCTAQRTALYLQASPEAHMKRLLAAGATAIYQVTRSFRSGEHGPLHRTEFTIVEWYRTGDQMAEGISLLDQLCRHLLGTPPARQTSYAEAMERYAGISPHAASGRELAKRAAELSITPPAGMDPGDRDEWLNLLLATQVEPHLGEGVPEILYDYPASQAALAKVRIGEDGKRVAERFELYWRGIELANGYHELTDADELRDRLQAVNAAREADDRPALPLPERLLAAMRAGLPDCTGVALGFDRLAMLAVGAKTLSDVVPFDDGVNG